MSTEVVPAVSTIANLADLRMFMGLLHEKWRNDPEVGHSINDPEVGHSINDDVRGRVLEMCAAGHPQAAELAREVLVTDTWDDCPVWYA